MLNNENNNTNKCPRCNQYSLKCVKLHPDTDELLIICQMKDCFYPLLEDEDISHFISKSGTLPSSIDPYHQKREYSSSSSSSTLFVNVPNDPQQQQHQQQQESQIPMESTATTISSETEQRENSKTNTDEEIVTRDYFSFIEDNSII